MSDIEECPDCGDQHDVARCVAEGGMCDCCASIEKAEAA